MGIIADAVAQARESISHGRQATEEKGAIPMGVIEKAVAWAIEIANNPQHGYSQVDRWGPDYDCSSFVISAEAGQLWPGEYEEITGEPYLEPNDGEGEPL